MRFGFSNWSLISNTLLCYFIVEVMSKMTIDKEFDEGETDNINEISNGIDDKIDGSKSAVNVQENEMIFRYWNKDYSSGDVIYINNASETTLRGWRKTTALKIITHGWLSSDESQSVSGIQKAYTATRDINVITVDWSETASWKAYPLPAYTTKQVGAIIARMIDKLINESMVSLDNVHLIGHSLGAHVAGASAKAVQHGQVARCTGLDPAGPGFEIVHHLTQNSLSPDDAQFVDIIHTAAGMAGYIGILGHADFYPNGGTPIQPGCENGTVACSHGRAYEYFKDSILHPHTYKAVQCPNWESFNSNSCDSNPIAYMGDETPSSVKGVYYLRTKPTAPYGLDLNTRRIDEYEVIST